MAKQITCFYHPDVVANTICERCHRPICLNDVRTYQRRYSVGHHGDHHGHYYVEKYRLCPLCHADWVERDNTGAALIMQLLVAAFAVIFLFFVLGLFSSFDSMGGFDEMSGFIGLIQLVFIIAPLIMIGIILYNVFVASPQRVKNARMQKEAFLASLGRPSSTTSAGIQGDDVRPLDANAALTCFECGAPLAITDKFCPNCGDPTIEERASLKR